MNIAEEHLANPSSISPSAPTLSLHIIPDNIGNAATNSPILPLPPETSSHRYPLQSQQPPSNEPILTTTPDEIPTVSVPPTQSQLPTSKDATLTVPHLIPDNETGSPIIHRTTSGPPDDFFLSTNPFGHSTDITLPVKGTHPTLGLSLTLHPDNDRIVLTGCLPSTPVGEQRFATPPSSHYTKYRHHPSRTSPCPSQQPAYTPTKQ